MLFNIYIYFLLNLKYKLYFFKQKSEFIKNFPITPPSNPNINKYFIFKKLKI